MKILVAPHPDDECLYAWFTCLREKPLVVVVFDCHIQRQRGAPVTAEQRRAETLAAMAIAGCKAIFLGFSDADPRTMESRGVWQYDHPITKEINAAVSALGATQIWAPAFEPDGHPQHNIVAMACDGLPVAARYLTYTRYGGKSTSARKVPYERDWPLLKLRALACYESQIVNNVGCVEHFIARSHLEYYA